MMENNEIFEAIYSDIKKFKSEGKIIKIFNGDDSASVVSIDKLCDQPIEGLLYDLDLDAATLMTLYKEKPLEFANNMAIYNVIEFLHKFYLDHKEQ